MVNKTVRQKTHDSVDKIMDKTESIADSSRVKMTHLKAKANIMKENTEIYIKKNPKKSVLVAAGAGVMAGGIIATVMMRKKH